VVELSSLRSATPAAATAAAEPQHRYGAILASLGVYVFAMTVLQTAVAPALPTIQHEFGVAATSAAWVLTATVLASCVAMPIFGRLGDMFGKRRILLIQIAIAIVGCLVAAVAQSLPVLITGRLLQGIGMGFAIGLGIIRDTFPVARRAAAFGMISALWGVAGAAGFPLSALVLDHLSYRWIFWLALILVVCSGIAVRTFVPESSLRTPGRIDVVGAVLLALGLTAVLVGLTQGQPWGWGSPRVIGLLLGGGAALIVFVRWELRVEAPLSDLRLLAQRTVWPVDVAAIAVTTALYVMYVLLPSLAQAPRTSAGLGLSASSASLLLFPAAVFSFVAAPLAGALGNRLGSRTTLLAGTVSGATALAVFASRHETRWDLMLTSALMGFGMGLALASIPNLISHAVPHEQIAEANAMTSLLRAVGASCGAVIAALLLARSVPPGGDFPAEHGYVQSAALVASLVALAAPLLLLVPRRQGRQAS
jgi:EmrB/QacA subfamily drug resistance transporter